MKSKKNLLEQLKSLPYFDKDVMHQLGEQLGLKNNTISVYISRFLKCKEIIQLKRGLYVSTDFFTKNRTDVSYPFYLANVIRTPSYVSSWAALQYYNLATEAIYSITSVTPKVTREYQTKAGNFVYQSIKKEFFSDFFLVNGKFAFFIASPSKALFDLLYFRTSQFRSLAVKSEQTSAIGRVKMLVEELRINIDEMDEKEQQKFYAMVQKII